ncbi:hypothetical protein SAMN05421678_11249 [Actinopolymorpha cephalotaxi]|uniref:DUF7144 domain-containing protein n=1 Tax=Actinopolymorpha cephalotaxi TaxID=504797 RepID=A0A1I2X882_9ACTN|nr:hypothetical protein [Actinopolymorpha cephalotaxi]NYH86112.1 hypothetical protein [Actinopolymorpha cephalotaxi]SFH09718.1 hypothetical protein SAMN05421678_11249 [Actinopolymorpha cephalotaxi]
MTDMGRRDTGAGAQEKRAEIPEQAQRGEVTTSSAEAPAGRMTAETEVTRSAGGEGLGWIMFAGAVLITVGVFEAIWGLTALFRTTYFVVPSSGLVVSFNYTAWGWVHIGLAVLLVATGLAVLAGQRWARYVGICLAALGMIANFLTFAAFPFWSLVMVAVDILVIYALSVRGHEMEKLRT